MLQSASLHTRPASDGLGSSAMPDDDSSEDEEEGKEEGAEGAAGAGGDSAWARKVEMKEEEAEEWLQLKPAGLGQLVLLLVRQTCMHGFS